jgi:hypothetical protein
VITLTSQYSQPTQPGSSIQHPASSEQETPVVPEVALCFENKLYRGNRTTKFNTEHFGAFVSGNQPEYFPEHAYHPGAESHDP